jgi:hypothetical protein
MLSARDPSLSNRELESNRILLIAQESLSDATASEECVH